MIPFFLSLSSFHTRIPTTPTGHLFFYEQSKQCLMSPSVLAPVSLFSFLYRLEEVGYGVGRRVIELISCRERITKRETRLVNFLQVS